MQQFIVLVFILANDLGESIYHADKVDTDGGHTSDTPEDAWEYNTQKDDLFSGATTSLKNGEERRSVYLSKHKGNKGSVLGLSDLYLSDKRAQVYEEDANKDDHDDNDVDSSFDGGFSLPVNDEDDSTNMRNSNHGDFVDFGKGDVNWEDSRAGSRARRLRRQSDRRKRRSIVDDLMKVYR